MGPTHPPPSGQGFGLLFCFDGPQPNIQGCPRGEKRDKGLQRQQKRTFTRSLLRGHDMGKTQNTETEDEQWLAVGGGWQLVAVGSWWRLVALAVGGWWFLGAVRFFFLGTGVHPHPPPTTYWCQTNLKYDFWGLGTTWPHQPPKIAGWLPPWATAKGRTPCDGASPLAQGGPPPVALSTSYRGVNATSFEIFGAQVARNKGIGEKFHHSWSGRVRCVGAPGRQSDRTGLLDFFSHQNMQTSKTNHRKRVTPLLTIVLSICEPVFWAD